MVRTALFPFEDQSKSYPGSMNVDLSHPGRVSPAFDHAALSGSTNPLHYFGASFVETKDADGNPIAFAFANKTVWKIQNGTISADKTFTGSVIQDICLVDNGSGASVLLAVFGTGDPASGGSGGNATRLMSTGVWTENTNSSSFLTAYFVKKNADQLGAATGTTSTGRTATVERKIAICPLGSNPVTAANWSTAQAVDNDPTWQINNIAVFEDRFVVGMPQGFYIRDQQEGRWKNMTPHVIPHGVNGKVTVSGENCVWYATRKELFEFDGRRMIERTPFRGLEKPRDMPQGRVSAIADAGDRGLVVLECWDDLLEGKHAATAGLRVFKSDGGVVTELTSDCTDGSMATTANMEDWGNTTTDYLVFAFPRPLSAIGIRTLLTSTANTATQSFTAPQTLDGTGTNNWVSLGSIIDASILSTSGRSMQVTGFPASSGESVISWTALNAFSLAGREASAPTGFSGTNLYWYRVSNATTAGFNASGAVAGFQEAFVVPARPGLPNSGLLSSSNNHTSLFRGSGITRVLEFVREGGRITWEDKYHVNTGGGGVFCIGWTASPSVQGSNGGPEFLMLGRFGQYQIMEGRTRDATQQKFPRLCQFTSSEPGPVLAIYNVQLGDPRTLTRLNKVIAAGVFVQPDDAIQLFVQADEWKVMDMGVRYGSHAEWDCSELGAFWRCHFFFLLSDTNQPSTTVPDPAAPYWQHIIADHDDVGDPYGEEFVQAAFPTSEEV